MKLLKQISDRSNNPFAAPPVTIACMGDSVTHGCFEVFTDARGNLTTRYAPRESYVQGLQDFFNDVFPIAAINVVNCGISGDSARSGLKRFERDVACYHPNLVIVNYGLNDCMSPEAGEKGATAYGVDMRNLFDKIAATGAEAMLLTPNMMGTYIDPSIDEPGVLELATLAVQRQVDGTFARYVDRARAMAIEMGIPIADTYAVWHSLAQNGADTTRLLSNRINHPNPMMHSIFVNKIIEMLLGPH